VSENGAAPGTSTIILTLTKEPWSLTISGECENIDLALAILEQAKRSFDLQWRVAAAATQMEAQKKNAEEIGRVRSILDHSRRQ
jgi:hypothetical protein